MGKACLKESCAFSPHCDSSYLHPSRTKGAARRDTKGTKSLFHTSTLPSLHTLCVHECTYCTAQTETHKHTPKTHTQAQDCSLLVAPRGYIVSPSPSSHREQNVDGYCPDAVIISLMLTQMSMGSSDKGFLIPHMNLAPKGRRRRGGVCGKYEGAA